MSLRIKSLIVFLLISMFPLSVLSLIAYYDFGTMAFYAQIAVIAIVVTLLSLLVSRRISEPLLLLAEAANQVAEGEVGVRVTPRGVDEMGLLMRHFNRMVGQLEQQREQLDQARSEAEVASRVKSEFIANISHEVKTPMNGIIGITELLQETPLNQEQQEYMDLLRQSSDTMMLLLSEMLDFSRIENGTLDVDRIRFDFRDLMEETTAPLARKARARGLELIQRVEENVPEGLIGDPARLRQVIDNITDNAIKFTNQGEVQILTDVESMSDEDVILRFRIRDTGVGLPEDKQALVFNAFAQADGTATRSYGGAGLGLTIATRLVESMKGAIWVKSPLAEPVQGCGPGSEFNFTVHMGIQPEYPSWQTRDTSLARRLALIVDDHEENLKTLHDLLSGWGVQVRQAHSGQEGLESLRQLELSGKTVDVVLIDAQMPEMDGFTLAEHINREFGPKTHRMMLLTSAGMRGDARRARRIGIGAYLTKPVMRYELLQALQELIGIDLKDMNQEFLITRHSLRETRRRFRVLILEAGRDGGIWRQKLVGWRHRVDLVESVEAASAILLRNAYDVFLIGMDNTMKDVARVRSEFDQHADSLGRPFPLLAGFDHAGSREDPVAGRVYDILLNQPFRAEPFYQLVHEKLQPEQDMKKVALDVANLARVNLDQPTQSTMLFEMKEALSLMGNDWNLFSEMVDLYAADAPVRIAEMYSALNSGDWESLERAAHTLKGSMANFRCPPGQSMAQHLEQSAGKHVCGDLFSQIQNLEFVSKDLLTQLRAAAKGKSF